MFLRFGIVLAMSGCGFPEGHAPAAPADATPTEGPTVVVTASYPGASSQVVADTIAVPIEHQVNGADGMVWIESESRDDGSYTARVRFDPKTDPKLAVQTVQNRAKLAEPALSELVKRAGISVKAGAPGGNQKLAVIALEDRKQHGHEALRRWSAAVVKRLVAGGVAVKPEVFPGPDEKRVFTRLDRAKCANAGVAVAAAREAVQTAGPAAKVGALKKLALTSATGKKVPLGSVATFEEVLGPVATYRVNLYPAVRISGTPPAGKTAAEAAAGWAELAAAERPDGFEVENLTAK